MSIHRRADRIRRRRAIATVILLAAVTATAVWANIVTTPSTGKVVTVETIQP